SYDSPREEFSPSNHEYSPSPHTTSPAIPHPQNPPSPWRVPPTDSTPPSSPNSASSPKSFASKPGPRSHTSPTSSYKHYPSHSQIAAALSPARLPAFPSPSSQTSLLPARSAKPAAHRSLQNTYA